MDYELLIISEDNKIELTEDGLKQIKKFEKAKLQLDLMEERIKQEFKSAMEERGIDNWKSNDGTIVISYTKPFERVTLDSKKIKEEYPGIYEQCIKKSNVSSSVRISVK